LRKRADKFIAFLKQICPVGSSHRQDLTEGKVVVRLSGSMKDYEANINVDAPNIEELWLHIGHMNLSPYEPTFMSLKPTEDLHEVKELDHRRVYVESTHVFAGLYLALLPLAPFDAVDVKFYKVELADRPIARFKPQPIPIVQMVGFEEWRRFWPRLRAVGRKGEDDVLSDSSDGELDLGDEENADENDENVREIEHDVSEETSALLDPVYDMYIQNAEAPAIVVAPAGPEESAPSGALHAEVPLDAPPPPAPAARRGEGDASKHLMHSW